MNFLIVFLLCVFLWMKANSTKQENTIWTGGEVNSKANRWFSRPIYTYMPLSGFGLGTGRPKWWQKRRNNEAFASKSHLSFLHFLLFISRILPWRFNKQLHVSFNCLNRTAGQLQTILWLALADCAMSIAEKRRTNMEKNKTIHRASLTLT